MNPYAKTYSLTLRPEPQRKQRRPNLTTGLNAPTRHPGDITISKADPYEAGRHQVMKRARI